MVTANSCSTRAAGKPSMSCAAASRTSSAPCRDVMSVSPRRRPGPITTNACGYFGWSSSVFQQSKAAVMGPGFRRDDSLFAAGLPHHLAVLFHEGRRWLVKQVEHELGRPAHPDALVGHHDRTLDQDGMGQHEIDELVIAPFWIGEVEFGIGRALFP